MHECIQNFVWCVYFLLFIERNLTVGRFILREATIFHLYYFLLIFPFTAVMVFSESFSTPNQSLSILPTPQSLPIKDQHPKNYIGSSFYPLPYQAVLVLEGCSLQDLLSWDISISSKSIKVKIQWSSNLKSTKGCIHREKIPNNLIESLCLHDLAQPLWSLVLSR